MDKHYYDAASLSRTLKAYEDGYGLSSAEFYRAHTASGRLIARHVGSGSPQRSQSGGVSGRIDRQQAEHTGPRVGCSSSSPHAAHPGARITDRSASAANLKL